MSLDGKMLAAAKSALDERRRAYEQEYERRLLKVYATAPRIRAVDAEIRTTMSSLIGVALGSENAQQVEDIRRRNTELQKQRHIELKTAGFSEDYLDDGYICPDCHDTGFINTRICDCLIKLYKEQQRASLSKLFMLGNETFENFDLSYYDDTPIAETGISPRRSMEIIYEMCVEYARKFSGKSMNLFFNGATGLGKTFLSACIARVVADNGNSVVYDMAASIFAKFEDAKFSRSEDQEDVRSEIKRYLACDLLIMDDLATEMTTSFTISALYEIINTRLINGCKTIVSSNLTLAELRRKYSEQIMSRLEGEYQVLTFRGDDIRRKRNDL